MTEIDQIAQEMEEQWAIWLAGGLITAGRVNGWKSRIRALSATHRLLSLSDLEQALEKAIEIGRWPKPEFSERGVAYTYDYAERDRMLAEARSLLGLPPS